MQTEIIQNAGLCLLQPFLKSFMDKLKVNNMEPALMASTIYHSLNYLCGVEDLHSWEFYQLICGKENLPKPSPDFHLSIDMLDECDTLLNAVINQWDKLSNCSSKELQTHFLQRKGELILSSIECIITMEKNSIDILLESLPWNIHLLPIMHEGENKVLLVDW